MHIRRITREGRVVAHVRPLDPNAAPHVWGTPEGIRLSAPAEPVGTRHGDTVEVRLDARSLAALDAVRQARTADEAAILEDAARYRTACAAVAAARRALRAARTPDTEAALADAFRERASAETALKLTARAGTAGRMPRTRPRPRGASPGSEIPGRRGETTARPAGNPTTPTQPRRPPCASL